MAYVEPRRQRGRARPQSEMLLTNVYVRASLLGSWGELANREGANKGVNHDARVQQCNSPELRISASTGPSQPTFTFFFLAGAVPSPPTRRSRWQEPNKRRVSPPVARPPVSSSPPRRRASPPPPPAASRNPIGTAPVPSRCVRFGTYGQTVTNFGTTGEKRNRGFRPRGRTAGVYHDNARTHSAFPDAHAFEPVTCTSDSPVTAGFDVTHTLVDARSGA